jgi:hypothetical protein
MQKEASEQTTQWNPEYLAAYLRSFQSRMAAARSCARIAIAFASVGTLVGVAFSYLTLISGPSVENQLAGAVTAGGLFWFIAGVLALCGLPALSRSDLSYARQDPGTHADYMATRGAARASLVAALGCPMLTLLLAFLLATTDLAY